MESCKQHLFLPTKICDNTYCTEYCQPDKLTLALAIRVFPGARSCSYSRQPYCVTQGSQNKSLSHRRLFVMAGFSRCSARRVHSHLSSVSGGHPEVFSCIPSSSVTPFSVSIMTSLSTVTLTLPESLLQGSLPKVNFHLKILNLITFAKPLLPYKATFTLCKDLAGTYLGVHYSVYFRWVVCLKNHRYHKKIMYFTFILSYL